MPNYDHPGSGSNPQCLPMDPNFLTPFSGEQDYTIDFDIYTMCSVSFVLQSTCIIPAKYTCPTGWTREYYGYLMAKY